MTKQTRRIILYISILLFAIFSAITVTYSLGYKYDFIDNSWMKTGSFRVATNISGAEVYLNSKLIGETSFVTNNFSKGRFLPRIFEIRVQKDGYHSWQKNIEIKSGFFSDYPSIVLVNNDLTKETVASASVDFGSILTSGFDLTGKYAYFVGIQSSSRENLMFIDVSNPANNRIFENILRNYTGGKFLIYDQNIYFLERNNVKVYNTQERMVSTLAGNVGSFYIDNGQNIFFINLRDRALYSQKIGNTELKLISESLPNEIIEIKKVQSINNSYYLLALTSTGTEMLEYNPANAEFIKVRSDITDFILSPDRKKITLYNKNEIWVKWLADMASQPERRAGDEELITRFSQAILGVEWYKNSEYLIINTGGLIKFTELDSRGGKRNTYDIAASTGKMLFDNDKILITEGNELNEVSLKP